MEMFECGDSGETMLEVGSVSHCLFSSKKLFIYCGRNSGPIILLAKSVSSEAVNSCHYVDEALLGGDKRGKRIDLPVCSLNVFVILIVIVFCLCIHHFLGHVIMLRNVPLSLSNIKISLVSFLVCSLNVSVIVILISFVMPYLLITLILQGQKSLGVCFKNEKLNHKPHFKPL